MEPIAQSDAHGIDEPSATRRPILVATDGLPQSDGALAVARLLGSRLGTDVRVLAVHAPLVTVTADAQLLLDPTLEAARRVRTVARARAQIRKLGVGEIGQVEVRDGDPARVIAKAAAEYQAQLVVVGIGRHEVIDRVFGEETALKLSRISEVPVLAVPACGAGTARRVVVATDFSEVSTRAAQLALRLLPESGTATLLHVLPPAHDEPVGLRALSDTPDPATIPRFARLRADLDIPKGVFVETLTLSGDAASEILDYSRKACADVVVVGSHGHGAFARSVMGSVTTKLLRGAANCAIAVIPARCVGDTVLSVAEERRPRCADRGRWPDILDAFTRRNVGRRTRLEVDDLAIGAQPQEDGYPLLGVAYDANDDRVDIMLGDLGTGERHLSRSISGADAIGLLTDDEGRDVALRLRHGTGQTILTLIR